MRNRVDASWSRSGFLVLMVSGCLFSLADVATAGQQTAAGIIGQVKDESGGILPGVTVTATSPALQVPSVTDVTNERGEYRLTPLPIGTYRVEYALSGFQTVSQENLRLDIGVQAKLDVVMKVGTLAETVTVSGITPVVDVTATASSTQFTRETLEFTPTSRNGLISLGAQTPGLRGRVDIGGGSVAQPIDFRTFGQKLESDNTIEGIVATMPDTSTYGANYFDYLALDEAKLQILSNGPEVVSSGVATTLLIKSGGNAFHGRAEYGYMSHSLESNNIDDALRLQGITSGNPLKQRTDQGGDLGGRLIRDKLWFYSAVRYRAQHRFPLGGVKPDGSPAVSDLTEGITDVKLSAQLTPSNRLIFWDLWTQKFNHGDDVSQFLAWESRTKRHNHIKVWKAEWQATPSNSLVMSAQFGFWGWTGYGDAWTITNTAAAQGIPQGIVAKFNNPAAEDEGGGRPSTFDLVTQKVTGTPPGGGGLSDYGKHDVKGTLSWYRPTSSLGNHEFKAGFGYQPYWITTGAGERGAAGQYRLIFSNGTPTQIDLYNGPTLAEVTATYLSAYGNDTWTIARRLTLNLGARYARDTSAVPAQCRLAGEWPFAPAACVDKIPFNTLNSIAPRLYFSYDVTGGAKTVLKGGWGRFYLQRNPAEIRFLNPFQFSTSTYRWHDFNGNGNYNPGEVNLDRNGGDFLRATGQQSEGTSFAQAVAGRSNPNEKISGTDQISLTLEHQLAQDVGVRLTGVYIRTFNELRYLNTLRPPSAYTIPITTAIPGPDGKLGDGTFITYYDFPAALAGLQNEFSIITNDPNANEAHKAIELQLTKRLSNRWQFMASYSATKNDIVLPSAAGDTWFVGGGAGRGIPQWSPNVDINSSNHTWEWVGRVSGLYMLPAQVIMSANFSQESGVPQARQALFTSGRQIPTIVLNVEPIGSIRLPDIKVLDIRVQKSFSLGSGRKIAVRANLYNALNANTVTIRNVRSGPTYLVPTAILAPRIVEFGVGYTF